MPRNNYDNRATGRSDRPSYAEYNDRFDDRSGHSRDSMRSWQPRDEYSEFSGSRQSSIERPYGTNQDRGYGENRGHGRERGYGQDPEYTSGNPGRSQDADWNRPWSERQGRSWQGQNTGDCRDFEVGRERSSQSYRDADDYRGGAQSGYRSYSEEDDREGRAGWSRGRGEDRSRTDRGDSGGYGSRGRQRGESGQYSGDTSQGGRTNSHNYEQEDRDLNRGYGRQRSTTGQSGWTGGRGSWGSR